MKYSYRTIRGYLDFDRMVLRLSLALRSHLLCQIVLGGLL